MAIQFIPGFQSKNLKKYMHLPLHAKNIDLYGDKYVIIKLPSIRVLRLLAQSLLLALIFATFLLLRTLSDASPSSVSPIPEPEPDPDLIDAKFLPLLIHDLANEGLLKTGNNAVFLGSGIDNATRVSEILNANDALTISATNLDGQSSIPGESFDFSFTFDDFHTSSEFIDRTLKVGGIAVVQLSNNPSSAFDKPSNYKIVYLRRFQATNILAMRKTGYEDATLSTQRRLLGYDHATEAKKAALENLEDVLLEPPRSASGKSSRYLKKTRYLPDLMGDSLESYPRRVFIDVGLPEKEGGSGTGWFAKNYPTRNLDFEMYKIETVTEESSGKKVPQVEEVGISDWLKINVKGEEYVVMKAEAEVVEEMVKSKAIRLVDELFLECKPRRNGNGSKKAYWECLALYGKLRDEGVAVHQWWG
ncbi:unnamed protein product [Dovyalis caffra]|uniref:DUF7870 domain-containing protein n=1 Tax=Dovyalis caffra TaxID=77055 RepID=A0AAV1S9Q3_9ROSI|nr:unnamed protein product [Dovyalis caffra]